jgi:hypothetical protein
LWSQIKKAAGFVGIGSRDSVAAFPIRRRVRRSHAPRGVDAIATREARIAPPMHKEDARMADQGKERPGGRKTEDAPAPPRMRQRAPALTKAELRAQADQALASATKPIVKLPTKLVRQCGRCGEFCSVMVEPGQAPPEFKCKSCDAPTRG